MLSFIRRPLILFSRPHPSNISRSNSNKFPRITSHSRTSIITASSSISQPPSIITASSSISQPPSIITASSSISQPPSVRAATTTLYQTRQYRSSDSYNNSNNNGPQYITNYNSDNNTTTTTNNNNKMAENRYMADYDKTGRASCKKCKQKLIKSELRMAKVVANFFHEGEGVMKQYHHPACIFETFVKARSTTKIVEGPDDVEGFADLKDEDKEIIRQLINETLAKKCTPKKKPPPKKKSPAAAGAGGAGGASKSPAAAPSPVKAVKQESSVAGSSKKAATPPIPPSPPLPPPVADDDEPVPESVDLNTTADKDNAFRQFRRVCADLADVGSYLEKTKIIKHFIQRGSTGEGFKGDLALLLKLLLPGEKGNKTVYNLNNKQLVKIFSQVFSASQDAMVEDLEQGDVAETVRIFFEQSTACPPHKKAILSLQDVDRYLEELSLYTKEDDQQRVLTKIARRCTANDLKMVVRLIKHDLRINAGAKHVLEALDPNAYEAFQASRDLKDVVERVLDLQQANKNGGGLVKKLSIKACLMTAVLPMLAEACKSVEFAFKRCPNGMYAEIKYDGERVQVHKQGSEFAYFSRSLKPVLPHKVQHFKEWIPQAFPSGADLILDAEVLLIDTNTGKPLPFGTLGVHKKAQFSDANVCLFIFDILHYNGETLMHRPVKKRRSILREVMTEVPNRILFSEMTHITKPPDLQALMMKVFREGLEGLVLKDLESIYEPGKRHWLKVKKDYLAEGAMADSADLVLLGAYYGTGNKGGLMSVFLMGCYDAARSRWVTVTKCHCGFDDKLVEKLQGQLGRNMEKISQDKTRIPTWLHMNKAIAPDFVVVDPKKSPVWEITGAEFSKSESHTADGISIRFPRMTKIRDDKDWTNHTDLTRLKVLFKKSKETADMPDFLGSGGGGRKHKTVKPLTSQSSVDSDLDNSSHSNSVAASSSPVKRKIKEEEEEVVASPAKKLRVEESSASSCRSPCKFGSGCYQTSPDHKAKYSHSAPPSTGATNGNNGMAANGGGGGGHLADVFSGMTFHVPATSDKAELLKRYIIAYDGDIVEDFNKSSTTYTVVLDKQESHASSASAAGKLVHIDWVWRCIKKMKIVPVSKKG